MKNEKVIGYSLIAFSVILFIILLLIKVQADKQSAFLCEKFHEANLNMATCPVHQPNSFWSNLSWMITIAFGIGLLVFAVGAYAAFFYKSFGKGPKIEFKEVDLSKLDEDEKKIYGIVKSKSGSAYQSDLIRETGFSKVRVTRILDKMELSGILERKRRGMTNIIVLK